MKTPAYIHGIHDPGGEHLMATRPGWIVFTEAIGADPDDKSGRDYSPWSARGFGVIVRLNYGYGSAGTIPTRDRYGDFARRVANFVAASRGCTRWIIGNEPNHEQERPEGVRITAFDYAECFQDCHRAVRALGSGHELIVAAIAPWNVQSGDWLDYFRAVCDGVKGQAGGIALHTYTHGHAVELVTSEARMGPPFADRRLEFRAYKDFLAYVPQSMTGLPVYITETNQDEPWLDRNNGWVQAAYLEIERWNRTPGTQKVHCLCLYRWPNYDQWGFTDKQGVQDGFRQAVQAGYGAPVPAQSPTQIPVQTQGGHKVHVPLVVASSQPEVVRDWDERLTARGVRVITPKLQPGQAYYRVATARWYDVHEARRVGPDHHILVDVLSEGGLRMTGVPVRVEWPGNSHTVMTQAKPGERWSANYPMSPSRNEFTVRVSDGEIPSEMVDGIGMGADLGGGFNAGEHTSTEVVFRVATYAGTPPAPPPAPEPQPAPNPPNPPTLPGGGNVDARALQAVLEVESGGRGFGDDGRMIIRLENHILAQRVPVEWYAAHFRHASPSWTGHEWRPSPAAAWRPVHTGRQADEWDAFLFASQFYPEQAAQSISMGAAQVMGFNHARVGYPSARAMYAALGDRTKGMTAQLLAFFAFLMNTTGVLTALRNRDWREVARLYNGPGNVDAASAKYEAAYRRLTAG